MDRKFIHFLVLALGLGACTGPPAQVIDGRTGQTITLVSGNTAEPTSPRVTTTLSGNPDSATGGGRKAALLLPLGSPESRDRAMAIAMENAARMALEDIGAGTLNIAVYDTAGDAAAAAELALKDGAELLIGPLFGSATLEIAPIARRAGIRAISFSNDPSAAGRPVYLIGSVPDQEFARILEFATRKGYRSIAALIPDSSYGNTAIDALARATGSPRAQLQATNIQRYTPDFDHARAAARSYAEQQTARGIDPATTALLLADGGDHLETLVGFLDKEGVSAAETQFLGSGVWDREEVAREESLQGGWFAAPDPSLRAAFSRRYRERYESSPPDRAALAYDAVAIAGVLADAGGSNPFSDAAIRNPAGFAGVTGAIRFRADGLNERTLAVLEVANGRFRIIDPAPAVFEGR